MTEKPRFTDLEYAMHLYYFSVAKDEPDALSTCPETTPIDRTLEITEQFAYNQVFLPAKAHAII